MNQKQYIFLIFSVLLYGGSTMLSSCGEPPPMRLTSKERIRIDTLYKERVLKLGPEMDSICDALFEQRVVQAVDSIIRIRKTEEIKLRARILGNEKS